MPACGKCGTELRALGGLPGVRRVMFPHVCKQIPKLGPAYVNSRAETWGTGTDWMPPAYGEYYAKYPAVYAAVKLRADATIAPPLRAYRKATNGELEELAPGHPLVMLLTKVNPHWTKGDLLRATSTYLDLWGSCFWILKKTSPSSPPTEIWTLRPDRMRVVPSQNEYIAGYWYQAVNGTKIPLRTDEVVWLRAFNPLDEYAGMSPIAPARLSVEMGHSAIQHNRNVFKNGMLWGNIALSTKDGATITEDQVAELRESLKERYAGTKNSNIPLILQNMEAKNLGLTNRDLEFMQSLRWSLEDVARVYAIPKPMLGDLERATYENINAAERIFWRSSMVPHLRFLEEQINEMLVPQFGDDSLLVAFDTSDIEALQEDANAEAVREQADIATGILTINEVRAGRGLDPVPWGDVYWAPFGLQPIESPEDAQGPMPLAGQQDAIGEDEPKRFSAGRIHTRGASGSMTWRKFQDERLADTFIGKVLALHERSLTKSEGEFRVLQSGLFAAQRREVVRMVGAQKDFTDLQTKAMPSLQLFNLADWVKRYIRDGAALYASVATLGGTQQANAFSLGIAFDLRRIQPWLDQRMLFWAGRVNEETGRLLMQEVEEAIEKGESIKQIQKRVEQVFEFSDVVRSERIARTEVQATLNEAAVEAYRQSGVVEEKMWLATLDDRVRDAHIEAHRQTVPIEANFIVGGEAISHPGEGSPENAINCRCTVAPIVRRRAWVPPIDALLNGHTAKG